MHSQESTNASRRTAAIGIFDSGMGGLTVVQAVTRALPDEAILYLGDTARLPYGTKSGATVVYYSKKSARFLLGHDVKMLLVACNTASAFALEALRDELPVPVLGAVEPGAEEAVAATLVGRVGVIGTLGTVRSGSYPRAIAARDRRITVATLACPLLVPLAEEGWLGDGAGHPLEQAAAVAIAERYLAELHALDPMLDVIVLGCTHYPLLRALLERVAATVWGRPIVLVDSAQAMARAARRELEARELLSPARPNPPFRCCLTDETRFGELGARFLGRAIDEVERVDL